MTQKSHLLQLISLKGSSALITGAASGIGRAIAERFAEAGAALYLIDKDSSGLKNAERALSHCAGGVETRVTDLSSRQAIADLWASLPHQAPNILVNNAGIYPIRPFLEVSTDSYQQVMDINLNAVHWMCQEFIQRRLKHGGTIINIGSIEAIQPFKHDLVDYSVSKAGVIALTRALAKEYAQHGFRVNTILPGGIITRGTLDVAKQVLRFKFGLIRDGYNFSQRLPAKRLGKPDEVARMALVLASDLATYVHGASIPVDGGFLSA